MSKRFAIFLKILFLLAVLAASALLYTPLKDYQEKISSAFLLPACKAAACLLTGVLAGFAARPESGGRGLYVFAAVVFSLFGLLPYLYGRALISLPAFVLNFSEYGQAGWLLTGLFACLAARSRRGRSA